jgi:uncharacterized phiE125 gp8 family phage protein
MPSILIAPPATEPLTLAETKLFLRVDGTAEDDLVNALIKAARAHVETVTARALITQGWRAFRDQWPSKRVLRIPRAPVISLDALTVHDEDGAAHLVDPSAYRLDKASVPARLQVSDAAPVPGLMVNGIEVDFTAGYGDQPTDVPEPLRLAMRRLVAHWYEHREADGGAEAAVSSGTPSSVAALLVPYRMISL